MRGLNYIFYLDTISEIRDFIEIEQLFGGHLRPQLATVYFTNVYP